MPAMTDILVKDDTVTTPVEYTLNPVGDNPPRWRASQAGVPLEGQIRFSFDSVVMKNGSVKNTGKLEVPVMETLGTSGTSTGYVAPQKVAFVETWIVTNFTDRRATNQNRADGLKMLLGIMQGASATTATGVLNQASAGNAFVNSSLAMVHAFIRVIKPT